MESTTKSSSSISYVLFMYREQLRLGGESQSMRLSRTKLSLTDKLIKKTARDVDNLPMEDVRAISRGINFKRKLKNQIHQFRKSQQNQADKEDE